MGGCRCSFRECPVTTLKYPKMHFFHYPLKDKERLHLWIKYSNRTEFLSLPQSQFKNKNVCAFHFRDQCFMNYKKNRLTPTAVPTLDLLGRGQAFDYETKSLVELPPVTDKHLIPPPGYVPFELSEDTYKSAKTKMEQLTYFSPASKRVKHTEGFKNKYHKETKILNKDFCFRNNSNMSIDIAYDVEEQSMVDDILQDIEQPPEEEEPEQTIPFHNYKMQINDSTNECDLFEETAATNTINILGIDEIEFLTVEGKEVNDESPSIDNDEPFTKASYIDTCNAYNMEISELKNELDRKDDEANVRIGTLESELAEAIDKLKVAEYKLAESEITIKELEAKLQSSEATNEMLLKINVDPLSPKPAAVQPGPLTKGQLFNGIKKYLTASMTALVRMEMFGSTERAWKPDEKQVSVELLSLGQNVYKYFNDEWRFRLPSTELVETWAKDVVEEDEEDL